MQLSRAAILFWIFVRKLFHSGVSHDRLLILALLRLLLLEGEDGI